MFGCVFRYVCGYVFARHMALSCPGTALGSPDVLLFYHPPFVLCSLRFRESWRSRSTCSVVLYCCVEKRRALGARRAFFLLLKNLWSVCFQPSRSSDSFLFLSCSYCEHPVCLFVLLSVISLGVNSPSYNIKRPKWNAFSLKDMGFSMRLCNATCIWMKRLKRSSANIPQVWNTSCIHVCFVTVRREMNDLGHLCGIIASRVLN